MILDLHKLYILFVRLRRFVCRMERQRSLRIAHLRRGGVSARAGIIPGCKLERFMGNGGLDLKP